MKRQLLILVSTAIFGAAISQTVVLDEDFEGYSDGQMLVQTAGLPWSTWTGAMNEDVPLSNEQAASGELSAKFSSTAGTGGPGDIMLRLGNRTEGSYLVNWKMYIPSGFGGYFNVQHNEIPGAGSWAVDITFRANGTIEYSNNVTATITTYPQDEWFDVNLAFDLDSPGAGMLLNGASAGVWMTNVQSDGTAGMNQLGGINFFAYSGTDQTRYYIDDVSFVNLFSTGIQEASLSSTAVYPNPTEGAFTVELQGVAPSAMVSLWDATGRLVIGDRHFGQFGAVARAQLDLGAHPAGIYLIRIRDGANEMVQRIVRH